MLSKKEILTNTAHRPWPLPKRPWAMQQTWSDLLFAHWPVSTELLKSLIPSELNLDTYNGQAWIGITPFEMNNVRFRFMPYIPTTANFYEINVRTYVHLNGKHGIYFFSLDASSTLSVLGARLGALPYHRAQMSVSKKDEIISYSSKRLSAKTPANLNIDYHPVSDVYESEKDSLEEWLTERYCLFQKIGKSSFIEIDIHHLKWPLQKAKAHIKENSMTKPLGFTLNDAPLLHFSKQLDVLVWPIKIVNKKS